MTIVQSPSWVWLYVTPCTAARQASLRTISRNLPKFMSIALLMSSSRLILCCPPLLPSIFLASGTFPMSQLFASVDQNARASASASILPMSIQVWFPLRFTSLISLLAKGLPGVFSSTTVQRHQFFGALPSLQSSSHNSTWPLGRPEPWLYGPLSAEWCLCFSIHCLVLS